MYSLSGRTGAEGNWSRFPGSVLSVGEGSAEDRCRWGQGRAGDPLGAGPAAPSALGPNFPWPPGVSEPDACGPAEAHLGSSVSPPTACLEFPGLLRGGMPLGVWMWGEQPNWDFCIVIP